MLLILHEEVLFNNSATRQQALRETAKKYSLPLTPDSSTEILIKTPEEFYEAICTRMDPKIRPNSLGCANFHHNLEDQIGFKIFPEVMETLFALRENGWYLALFASDEKASKEKIRKIGLRTIIDQIIPCQQNTRSQNGTIDTTPITRALSAFGVPRDNTLYVGVHSQDVQMGKAADVFTALYYPASLAAGFSPNGVEPDFHLQDFSDIIGLV